MGPQGGWVPHEVKLEGSGQIEIKMLYINV